MRARGGIFGRHRLSRDPAAWVTITTWRHLVCSAPSYAGGTLVIAKTTDPSDVFATVSRERVTVIAAAVPLITTSGNSSVAQQFDISSLRVIQNGGAPLAPELRARLRKELGCTPPEIYGTAEGLINMTRLTDSDDVLLESSGAPVSEFDEIDVLDDAGKPVPDGEPGQFWSPEGLTRFAAITTLPKSTQRRLRRTDSTVWAIS